MQLVDFLDKGASLGGDAPCLTMGPDTLTYTDVATLSHRVARALRRSGIGAGDQVAILSSNDPIAFSTVFGISRAGAVWCPINPRNEAAENRELLDLFDASCLVYQHAYRPLVERIVDDLPKLTTLVCLDPPDDVEPLGVPYAAWLDEAADDVDPDDASDFPAVSAHPDDVVMLAGTGGTTGAPKGVQLTGHNLETMTSLTLMSYPFDYRPTYLAFAPLTHAAGVLCFPIMALGGEIVIMPKPDIGDFIDLVEQHAVTHAFLPPTVIYLLLDHPGLERDRLSSLQCLWYGAAPMSATRLADAVTRLGPIMAQLYGQTEAPMMISTMAPWDHLHDDGSLAVERFASAGRPSPLCTVGIMGAAGALVGPGERGEIVVKGPLVSPGYHRNPGATAEARTDGWHRTGDIGYLDDDNWLFIVDRAKDMIITGGYNVYSAEVEQALMQHEAVRDCAVVGLPDDKWGERVTAVLELHDGASIDPDEVMAFVKSLVGAVKSPKQVEVWPELPRSKVGKIVKVDVKARLAEELAAAEVGAAS